jgi:hypothetical protein
MTAETPFKAATVIFHGPGQRARALLAEGQRIVLICRGAPASVLPIEAPGGYWLDPQILPGGAWPVVMCIVPVAQLPWWLGTKAETFERVFDQIAAMVERSEGRLN